MQRNFFLQLLPDMEEVYYNGSTSDEDERAIFITQQNGTLNTGEDSPKAGGLENEDERFRRPVTTTELKSKKIKL
ncbi:unnamed protein product [Porites lobata]|uniref:Uncharacterized protein n=1 Tax=Porites lobata TaxID=104759 RepID=A0ABN8REA3_9CNID|nr:unnamed protein product [Porites lobata]